MAVYEFDPELIIRIDDLIPTTVLYMNDNVFSYIEQVSNLSTFLQSISFNFDDYSAFANTRLLSKRVRIPILRIGTMTEITKPLFTIYVPSPDVYKFIFTQIQSIYLDKWKKIKAALEEEYGIIKPYDMSTIEHEDNKLITKTDGTQTHAYTDSDNVTKDDEHSEDKIYGFNSTDGVKSDSNSTTHQMTSNGTDSGTKTNTLDYNSDRDVDKTTTRTGNTGNITSQEMIERELKLREYLLYQVIYKDLNEYLTLMVY